MPEFLNVEQDGMKLVRETDTFDTFLNPHGTTQDSQVMTMTNLCWMIGLSIGCQLINTLGE